MLKEGNSYRLWVEKVEKKEIDGTTYEISNGSQVEIWNCKTAINEIYTALDPSMFDMQLTPENYITFKKELISKLKNFDKMYTKHIKSAYVEMSAIHNQAMLPLSNLLESNRNLHFLEELMKKKEVPKFRFEALEEKFIGHMTKVCEIFTTYGKLKESFNIK
jgi:hypothetical protein